MPCDFIGFRTGLRATLTISICALVLVSCSGTELPRVETFDGSWRVTSLTSPDADIDRSDLAIVVDIDTTTAAIVANTPCGLVLGSYSLVESDAGAAGGAAGFTLPGAGTAACSETDAAVRDAFVVAAESVDQWSSDGDDLVFTDSAGRSTLVLTPVE